MQALRSSCWQGDEGMQSEVGIRIVHCANDSNATDKMPAPKSGMNESIE